MREGPRKSADEETGRRTRRCWVFRESEEGEEERLHVTLHGKDTRQGKLKIPASGPYPIPSPSRPLEQAAANLKIGSIPSPTPTHTAACRGSTNFSRVAAGQIKFFDGGTCLWGASPRRLGLG